MATTLIGVLVGLWASRFVVEGSTGLVQVQLAEEEQCLLIMGVSLKPGASEGLAVTDVREERRHQVRTRKAVIERHWAIGWPLQDAPELEEQRRGPKFIIRQIVGR